jgi:hypothetical protein
MLGVTEHPPDRWETPNYVYFSSFDLLLGSASLLAVESINEHYMKCAGYKYWGELQLPCPRVLMQSYVNKALEA